MKCRWAGSFLRLCCRKSSSLAVPPVVLRPYQEQCLDACLDALEAGLTRLGVSLPTGSGKTTVFVSLLSRLSPPATNENATRSLIIVNSIELARQSAEQVLRLFPDWTVEIEQGGKHVASGFADVTVATYQTLNREHRLQKFDPSNLKAVIVDEAHHAAAKSYRALLSRFHPDIKHPDPEVVQVTPPHKIPIIGFSATFRRHDGLALGSVFEHMVYHRDFLEMIKEQWLCDVRFTSVRAKLDLEDVAINGRNGDFVATSLAQVVNTSTVNELVVKAWIDRASTRRSTLVFCVNIDHVKALTQTFRKYGIDARYVFAETPPAHRKNLIADFKNCVFPVLVNCAILTEGADIPNIDCVLVARPTRSRNVFAQMVEIDFTFFYAIGLIITRQIGRGMRLSPQTGKENCRIIDFMDSNARVKGVISAPTLFGLDPSLFDCEDETRESLEKRAEEGEKLRQAKDAGKIPNPTSIIYMDHEDPFDVLDYSDKAGHIYSLSPLAWVACGNGIYVLELLKKGYIRIEPDDSMSHYVASFTPASWANPSEGASPFLRSRSLLTAENLAEAVNGADTYVAQRIFRNIHTSGLYRTAKWRSSPASDGQKGLVEKRWLKTQSNLTVPQKEEFLAKLTKGSAATLITRIKHGAVGRLQKKVKAQKKVIDASKKEQLRVAREEIRVGPLVAI